MTEAVDPADLRRLKARTSAPTRHADVVMEPGESPRCGHCGETLSPDDLRRSGIKPV